MSKKKNNSTEQFVRDSILFYYSEKKTNDASNASFDQVKLDFKNVMERYFDKFSNEDGKIELDVAGEFVNISKLILTRVQPSKIIWDIKKLKDVLVDKKQKQLVIQKNYSVTNWDGFLSLLKESGIKPKDLKEFITSEETVRVNQLDKLIDLGLVDDDKVKKCCNIELSPAYYRIKEK